MAKRIGEKEKTKGKKPEVEDKERQGEIAGNVTQETFLQSVQELNEANARCAAANELRKKTRKTIKARGIELGDLDETIKKADWTREEVSAQFKRRRQYGVWLGLPIGEQSDLFEGSAEEVAFSNWEARGKTAAMLGKPGQVPDEVPEPYKLAWKRGWKIQNGETPPPKPQGEKDAAPKAKKDPATGKILAPDRDAEMDRAFETAGAAASAGDPAAKTASETDAALN